LRTRLILVMGIVLGVTGDIGSGKSTVMGILRELGAETVSADELAHNALAAGTPGAAVVAERFGESLLQADGNIDRNALGEIVFHDEQARRDLEGIVHPVVLRIVEKLIREYRGTSTAAPVMAVEVPLLYESGAEGMFDRVLTVTSEQETLLSRLNKERGLSRLEALSRLTAQLPSSEKASRSDYVVKNDSNLRELRKSVHRLWLDIACPLAH